MDSADLIGGSVLVGLTFVANDGSETYESYVGRILDVRVDGDKFESLDGSDSEIVLVKCHDGTVREYPFDPEAIGPADPGFYELPDGATIDNPDFEMSWRVTAPITN